MTMILRLPFEGAEKTPIFACSENEIDWDDIDAANRCTVAFAATELADHFRSLGCDVGFASANIETTDRLSAAADDQITIALLIDPDNRPEGSFTLVPSPSSPQGPNGGIGHQGVEIRGTDRIGVLYGAYELLRLQGWSWLEPGPEGEYAPESFEDIIIPGETVSMSPAFPLWRGFDFSFLSRESERFLLWMARNRLNLAGYRAATGAFGRKLGMRYKNGGHIFESILDPDNTTEDGRSFWDAHREWYGLPASGEKTREAALRTQFCISRPDLLDYLGEALVKKIEADWHESELIAVWGFDTWGSCCTCDECRSLGNDSDQYLRLLSHLRTSLNDAIASGRIRADVRMAGCAYEGTSTLTGPEREIPGNLREAGDAIIYYPIDRSYAAPLFDPDEPRNRPYAVALESWVDRPDALPVIVGEYYNVSKFEDLPALFSSCISADLTRYHDLGIAGMTYMHVPMVNWAVRAQTQVLYADRCWFGAGDRESVIESYFAVRYGDYASKMKRAYRDVETAYARISEWRAWHNSILDFLLKWDGNTPSKPMRLPEAFSDALDAINSGRKSLELLRSSYQTILGCEREERDSITPDDRVAIRHAENPIEAAKQRALLSYERALGEDKRLLRYGIDAFEAEIEIVEYYEALRTGAEARAEVAWKAIEDCVERLDSYWVPISYEYPGPGLVSLDGYSRSQLRIVVNRIRMWR